MAREISLDLKEFNLEWCERNFEVSVLVASHNWQRKIIMLSATCTRQDVRVGNRSEGELSEL